MISVTCNYVRLIDGIPNQARNNEHIAELFEDDAFAIGAQTVPFTFRYLSDDHWIEVFRTYYGPVLKTFEALDAAKQQALTRDLKALIARFNVARDGTMVVPADYLQVVILKR